MLIPLWRISRMIRSNQPRRGGAVRRVAGWCVYGQSVAAPGGPWRKPRRRAERSGRKPHLHVARGPIRPVPDVECEDAVRRAIALAHLPRRTARHFHKLIGRRINRLFPGHTIVALFHHQVPFGHHALRPILSCGRFDGHQLAAQISLLGANPYLIRRVFRKRFDVVQLPTGEVIDVRLAKSSGVRAYDDAVQRAILKSSPLPRPAQAELFVRTLELRFRPQE